MRILMITPDVQIDRRILHEAETLYAAGHEIILIADGQIHQEKYKWISHVKSERFTQNEVSLSPLQHIIIQIKNQCVSLMHKFSSLRLHLFKPASASPDRFRKSVKNFSKKGFSFLKEFLTLSTDFLLQGVSKLNYRSRYQKGLLERVLYYDPDIIHVHDLPTLKMGVIGKQKLEVPLIYDAHELYPEIHTLTPRQQKKYHRVEKRLIPHCDHVITVNAFIAQEMSQRYQISPPTVIWNSIQPPLDFDPATGYDRFREDLAIPADHKILLYQGWYSSGRGLENLISAMSKVPEFIHLVLMGYGKFQTSLSEIVHTHNLSRRVHFKPAVAQEELLFWTASADAGIIPYPSALDINTRYCSPNKLFEFIQAEVPIIANDLPFLRQVIAGEGFGLIMALDQKNDFVKAITSMFDQSAGGPERFKTNLRKRKSNYNWDLQGKKLMEIYKIFTR